MNEKILIIDDNFGFLAAADRGLSSLKYYVDVAQSVTDGLMPWPNPFSASSNRS